VGDALLADKPALRMPPLLLKTAASLLTLRARSVPGRAWIDDTLLEWAGHTAYGSSKGLVKVLSRPDAEPAAIKQHEDSITHRIEKGTQDSFLR
jgi:hypothetical protein